MVYWSYPKMDRMNIPSSMWFFGVSNSLDSVNHALAHSTWQNIPTHDHDPFACLAVGTTYGCPSNPWQQCQHAASVREANVWSGVITVFFSKMILSLSMVNNFVLLSLATMPNMDSPVCLVRTFFSRGANVTKMEKCFVETNGSADIFFVLFQKKMEDSHPTVQHAWRNLAIVHVENERAVRHIRDRAKSREHAIEAARAMKQAAAWVAAMDPKTKQRTIEPLRARFPSALFAYLDRQAPALVGGGGEEEQDVPPVWLKRTDDGADYYVSTADFSTQWDVPDDDPVQEYAAYTEAMHKLTGDLVAALQNLSDTCVESLAEAQQKRTERATALDVVTKAFDALPDLPGMFAVDHLVAWKGVLEQRAADLDAALDASVKQDQVHKNKQEAKKYLTSVWTVDATGATVAFESPGWSLWSTLQNEEAAVKRIAGVEDDLAAMKQKKETFQNMLQAKMHGDIAWDGPGGLATFEGGADAIEYAEKWTLLDRAIQDGKTVAEQQRQEEIRKIQETNIEVKNWNRTLNEYTRLHGIMSKAREVLFAPLARSDHAKTLQKMTSFANNEDERRTINDTIYESVPTWKQQWNKSKEAQEKFVTAVAWYLKNESFGDLRMDTMGATVAVSEYAPTFDELKRFAAGQKVDIPLAYDDNDETARTDKKGGIREKETQVHIANIELTTFTDAIQVFVEDGTGSVRIIARIFNKQAVNGKGETVLPSVRPWSTDNKLVVYHDMDAATRGKFMADSGTYQFTEFNGNGSVERHYDGDRPSIQNTDPEVFGPFYAVLAPTYKGCTPTDCSQMTAENPTNAEFYKIVEPSLNRIKKGGAVVTVGYGYSGSGKTHGFFNLDESKDQKGIVYQFLEQSKPNKIELCCRELYGESADMSLAHMTNMCGEIHEYIHDGDESKACTWRGTPIDDIEYVPRHTTADFPTKVKVVKTRVVHANLTDRAQYLNFPSGFVTGVEADETAAPTTGHVYKDADNFVGCYAKHGSAEYLERYQIVEDPTRITQHARDANGNDILDYMPSWGTTYKLDGQNQAFASLSIDGAHHWTALDRNVIGKLENLRKYFSGVQKDLTLDAPTATVRYYVSEHEMNNGSCTYPATTYIEPDGSQRFLSKGFGIGSYDRVYYTIDDTTPTLRGGAKAVHSLLKEWGYGVATDATKNKMRDFLKTIPKVDVKGDWSGRNRNALPSGEVQNQRRIIRRYLQNPEQLKQLRDILRMDKNIPATEDWGALDRFVEEDASTATDGPAEAWQPNRWHVVRAVYDGNRMRGLLMVEFKPIKKGDRVTRLLTPMERALEVRDKFYNIVDGVTGFEQAYATIQHARKNEQHVLSTPNNDESSRGHLFLTLRLTYADKVGYWTVGDLAGSENPLDICQSTICLDDTNMPASLDRWKEQFRTTLRKSATKQGKNTWVEQKVAIPSRWHPSSSAAAKGLDVETALRIARQGCFINESNHHMMAYLRSQDPQVGSVNLESGLIDMGLRGKLRYIEDESTNDVTTDASTIEKMITNKLPVVYEQGKNNILPLDPGISYYAQDDGAFIVLNVEKKGNETSVVAASDVATGWMAAAIGGNTVYKPNAYINGPEVFVELRDTFRSNYKAGDDDQQKKFIDDFFKKLFYDPARAMQNPVAQLHNAKVWRMDDTKGTWKAFLRLSVARTMPDDARVASGSTKMAHYLTLGDNKKAGKTKVDWWNDIQRTAVDKWNAWNKQNRSRGNCEKHEPYRGFVLMTEMLRSVQCLGTDDGIPPKFIVVQNMRTETSLVANRGKELTRGVQLTLDYANRINPVSYKSMDEIALGKAKQEKFRSTWNILTKGEASEEFISGDFLRWSDLVRESDSESDMSDVLEMYMTDDEL